MSFYIGFGILSLKKKEKKEKKNGLKKLRVLPQVLGVLHVHYLPLMIF